MADTFFDTIRSAIIDEELHIDAYFGPQMIAHAGNHVNIGESGWNYLYTNGPIMGFDIREEDLEYEKVLKDIKTKPRSRSSSTSRTQSDYSD